jgi:hypothetical protein
MAESKGYTYRVLARLDGDSDIDNRPSFHTLGDFSGRTPDEAIEAAVKEIGMPNANGGLVVAVPVRSWHEREAKRHVEPVWEVGPIVEAAPGEPPPDPA